MSNPVFPNLATGNTTPRPAKTSVSAGQHCMMGEEITVSAAQLTLNALFGSIKVPKNAVITGAGLYSTDVDTGSAAVVMAVGDVTVDDRLITGAITGQTGTTLNTTLNPAGYGYQYTAETLIQIKIKTIPAAAAAGTLRYHVTYIVP